MKEQIIETSLQQFLKYGIKKMTVQKLVEPMGISTKTVYKSFADKEDLLRHCLLKHYSTLADQFSRISNEDKSPVVIILEIWYGAITLDFGVNHVFYYDLNYYYPKLQDAILHKIFKKNFSILEDLIRSGMEQGYFREDIVPEVIPEVTGILYSAITRTGQLKKYKLTAAALMQNTIDPYLRGLCTDKGLKEFKKYYSSVIK